MYQKHIYILAPTFKVHTVASQSWFLSPVWTHHAFIRVIRFLQKKTKKCYLSSALCVDTLSTTSSISSIRQQRLITRCARVSRVCSCGRDEYACVFSGEIRTMSPFVIEKLRLSQTHFHHAVESNTQKQHVETTRLGIHQHFCDEHPDCVVNTKTG